MTREVRNIKIGEFEIMCNVDTDAPTDRVFVMNSRIQSRCQMDDETDAIVFRYIICIRCQRVSFVDKRVSVAFFDANPKCPECKGDLVPAEIVGDPPD